MNLKPNMNQLIALDSGPLKWQKDIYDVTQKYVLGTVRKTSSLAVTVVIVNKY